MNTTNNQHTFTNEDKDIDLVIILNQIITHKWLIIFVTAIMLSIGLFYSYKQIPQYQSGVLLQVDTGQSRLGGVSNQFFGGVGMAGSTIAAQQALIQSRFILEPVVQALNLDISITAKKAPFVERFFITPIDKRSISLQMFEVPQTKINKSFQLVVDKPHHVRLLDLKNNIILQGAIGTLLTDQNKTIHLFVKSVDAPVGAHFTLTKQSKLRAVQGLANHLTIGEMGNKKNLSTGILDIELKGENPEKLVKILNVIAKVTKDKDAKKKSQEASQTLGFLYQQLPITKKQLEKAENALNSYRSKSGKIDMKLQTQFLLNQLSDLDKKLSELRIKKIDMLQRYTPYHPEFIALNTQIMALERQQVRLQNSLKLLPSSDQHVFSLLRDVKVKQSLYVLLLNKIQELKVIKAGTVSSIRILSKARIPDSPLPGKSGAIYLGSIIAGFILSALIISARRLLSPRVDDPSWCERQYNLPTIAIVPYCKEQAINAVNMDSSKQLPLLSYINPKNTSIESLRSLRTSLQVSLAGASNNIVSILGVSPAVGKSFVSVNLAHLLSSAGKKVLLIDADLRRGTAHKYLNIPFSPGLSDVLNGTVSVEQALAKFNDNLTCLPRGMYPSDPSELLMRGDFTTLLQTLSSEYDVIVIDTAPILLVTDATIVGRLAGVNYIVFGAGVHQPTEIDMVLKRLMSVDVKLNGSIFNFHRVHSQRKTYGSYYNYNYTYNYYADDEKTKIKI